MSSHRALGQRPSCVHLLALVHESAVGGTTRPDGSAAVDHGRARAVRPAAPGQAGEPARLGRFGRPAGSGGSRRQGGVTGMGGAAGRAGKPRCGGPAGRGRQRDRWRRRRDGHGRSPGTGGATATAINRSCSAATISSAAQRTREPALTKAAAATMAPDTAFNANAKFTRRAAGFRPVCAARSRSGWLSGRSHRLPGERTRGGRWIVLRRLSERRRVRLRRSQRDGRLAHQPAGRWRRRSRHARHRRSVANDVRGARRLWSPRGSCAGDRRRCRARRLARPPVRREPHARTASASIPATRTSTPR